MKIGVSSNGKDLNAQVDQRFGRCDFFIIIQTDDMSFDVFENENKSLTGGAGIKCATFLDSKGVEVVLTGNCGPNAENVFSESGIHLITGQSGVVKEVVEKYIKDKKANPADTVKQSNVQPQGKGRCMGGTGRGQGRGQGRGRGMGQCQGQGQIGGQGKGQKQS
jgi:predicted Fe-Mo cluster-binding NifX family protein